MTKVLVQGCGLIGTSIGLSLRGHASVLLADVDEGHLTTAVSRGAGQRWDGSEHVDIAVVAAPPRFTADLLMAAQRRNVARTYTHVSSVQSQVQREVEALGCELSSIVGGHPMAGRETSGPSAAATDLFVGRPWAVCASPGSDPLAVADVRWLAEACGAFAVEVGSDEHDAAVALLSHLPQVAASALAGLLVPGADGSSRSWQPRGEGSDETSRRGGSRLVPSGPVEDGSGDPRPGGVGALPRPGTARDVRAPGGAAQTSPEVIAMLSGPGLADTTRLAASDPSLWTDILTLNASRVAPAIHDLVEVLGFLAQALEEHAAAGQDPGRQAETAGAVRRLLERGNAGRSLVPVKRGEVSDAFDRVGVSVDDKPGRLAALLVAAGDAGINVEDVHVEHVPGRPQGVIELLVDRAVSAALRASLATQGWIVLGS